MVHVVPKPTSSNHTFIYHPLTGLCVRSNYKGQIFADDCHLMTGWSHSGDWTPIHLSNTPSCIEVVGDGLPVRLSMDCFGTQSTWRSISNSIFQITSKDGNGVDLCLDIDHDTPSTILSKRCNCVGDDSSLCMLSPQSQWFQFISTNNILF